MPDTLPRLELDHNRDLFGPLRKDGPSYGNDVLAVKRMLKRWDEGLFSGTLATLDKFYNQRTANAVVAVQRFWRASGSKEVEVSGVWDEATHERSLRALRDKGRREPQQLAWDALAISLYQGAKPAAPPARCHLYPLSVPTKYLGGVAAHMSRALGNWQSDNAIDVHAPMGSPSLAVKPGYVSKVGGVDPHRGPVGTIFGEHTTIEHDDGTATFYTHLDRIVGIGERVLAGEIIGKVADWPRSFIMDHTHLGARGFNPEAILKWPRIRIPFSD